MIDKEGNIAAMTHTINSVIWGDTGIVVGGIPIPDSAGFQQARLATIKPGDRLPNEMVQTIVFTGDKPILATAAIGRRGSSRPSSSCSASPVRGSIWRPFRLPAAPVQLHAGPAGPVVS